MSDIFISYARSTEPQARRIADALRAAGYGVWVDDQLPAHRTYGEVIEERRPVRRALKSTRQPARLCAPISDFPKLHTPPPPCR